MKELSGASAGPTFELPLKKEYAQALDRIVQSLVSPMDLSQSGQVEYFVRRLSTNPKPRAAARGPATGSALRCRLGPPGNMDEHARWITNERQLLDLLGNDLRRQYIVLDGTATGGGKSDDLTKAALAKQGDFVAVIDPEGRFKRLLDRDALLERVAGVA